MILGWNKTYGINNNVVKLIIANNLIVYRFTNSSLILSLRLLYDDADISVYLSKIWQLFATNYLGQIDFQYGIQIWKIAILS